MTLRSAVKGVIDYTQLDIHNPMWWKRWRYLLKGMTEVEHGELLRIAYDFQLALISNSKISPDDFTKLQKDAKDTFADIEGSYKPWLGLSKEDRKVREVAEFKEAWQEMAGFSVDDKEALAEWEASVRDVTEKAFQDTVNAEQEEAARRNSFGEKVREIQEKRLRQQGRLR